MKSQPWLASTKDTDDGHPWPAATTPALFQFLPPSLVVDMHAEVGRVGARLEGRRNPGIVGIKKEGGPVAGLRPTRTRVIPVRPAVRRPKNPVGAGAGGPPGAGADHAQ